MASDYRKEFPDFPASDIVELPKGFVDQSWHNDTCPSFLNSEARLLLWVDYADAAARDVQGGKRFTLVRCSVDGEVLEDAISVACDDWQEMLAYIAASDARR